MLVQHANNAYSIFIALASAASMTADPWPFAAAAAQPLVLVCIFYWPTIQPSAHPSYAPSPPRTQPTTTYLFAPNLPDVAAPAAHCPATVNPRTLAGFLLFLPPSSRPLGSLLAASSSTRLCLTPSHDRLVGPRQRMTLRRAPLPSLVRANADATQAVCGVYQMLPPLMTTIHERGDIMLP